MNQRLFTLVILVSILVGVAACQPVRPTSPPESTGEKVLKALVREGVTLAMNEYSANSGLFSINTPPDWVTAEHADGSGVIMASSNEALSRFQVGDAPTEGDAVLNTTLVPMSFFGSLYIEVEPGMNSADLAAAIMPVFGGPDGATVNEPQIVALGGGREAAVVVSATGSAEGVLVLFEINEGVIALTTVVVPPGAMDAEDVETVARVIIGSLEFTGTVDELIEAIDPVRPPDAAFG